MPRGIQHPPELRAQAVAAVLAGEAMSQVARRFGIGKATLAGWLDALPVRTVRTDNARGLDPIDLGERILVLIDRHIAWLEAELQASGRPDWLEKQSAADLAPLVVAQRDTLIRLLAGLQPADYPDAAPDDLDRTT